MSNFGATERQHNSQRWTRERSTKNDGNVGYWTREQIVKMDNRALARLVAIHPGRCPSSLKTMLFNASRAPDVEKQVFPVIHQNPNVLGAEEFLVKMFDLEESPPPRRTGRQIMREVAARYGLTVNDLECASRRTSLAKIRHEAMYLMARDTLLSLPSIGRLLGDRDHTTIWHGIRKHAERNGLPKVREGVAV